MTSFTCIACQVAFANFEIQREHYKSDWHRYNLKRKVAELPPVTADNFKQRVLAQRSQQDELENKLDVSHYCNCCRKHFTNSNAYANHLKSKKHLEVLQKQEKQQMPQEVPDSVLEKNRKNAEKSEQIAPAAVVPSNLVRKTEADQKWKYETSAKSSGATSMEAKNAIQRKQEVDDVEDDDDYEEWEDVEGEPLGLEECLFCSFVSSDLEANVKHMTEAHSFFIPDFEYLTDLEGLVSYLAEKVGVGNVCLWCSGKGKSFYSAKSVQRHMLDKGHCKMLHQGPVLEEYGDFYDYSTSYPEQDGEPTGPDQEVEIDKLNDEAFQMVLPSGSVIGHRALLRYYRQNLPPERPHTNRRLLHTVMSHYRALGWTGTTGQAAQRKVRDITLYHMKRAKREMQQGVKNNKLQRHFRPQVLF